MHFQVRTVSSSSRRAQLQSVHTPSYPHDSPEGLPRPPALTELDHGATGGPLGLCASCDASELPGAGAKPLYSLRLREQPARKLTAEEPRTSTLPYPSPGTLVPEANGPLAPPLPAPSLHFRNTTRTALMYLNCHKEGAVQLGNALRAEPGGISGPHCPVGLCPREEYWENPGKGGSESVSHSAVSDSLRPYHRTPPGSWVHGISQARILEWVAFFPQGDIPDPGIKPGSYLLRQILYRFETSREGHHPSFHQMFSEHQLGPRRSARERKDERGLSLPLGS